MNENNVQQQYRETETEKQFCFCFASESFLCCGIEYPDQKSSWTSTKPTETQMCVRNRLSMIDNEERTTMHQRNEVYDFIDIPHVLFFLWHSKYCKNMLLFFFFRNRSSLSLALSLLRLNCISLWCRLFECNSIVLFGVCLFSIATIVQINSMNIRNIFISFRFH